LGQPYGGAWEDERYSWHLDKKIKNLKKKGKNADRFFRDNVEKTGRNVAWSLEREEGLRRWEKRRAGRSNASQRVSELRESNKDLRDETNADTKEEGKAERKANLFKA